MAISTFETQHNKSFISFIGYISLALAGTAIGTALLFAGGREAAMPARALLAASPSFGMLFASSFLPLALTFLSVRWRRRFILAFLILLKSALFSFSACTVFAAFPKAGWLLQFLVLFSQWAEICVYHWLWMRLCVFQTGSVHRDFLICCGVLLPIILFDYLFICKFTASLFIHK